MLNKPIYNNFPKHAAYKPLKLALTKFGKITEDIMSMQTKINAPLTLS